jgi:hypothetical protein
VKQSDLGEYKDNAREKQNIQYTRKSTNSLSNQAIRMANTNSPPPQISKSRRIKGFGENVNQLPLCVYVSHLNISFLNVISQKVVSPLKASHSLMEDWIFGYRDGTGVIAHEGNSIKPHSKVSHGVHNP